MYSPSQNCKNDSPGEYAHTLPFPRKSDTSAQKAREKIQLHEWQSFLAITSIDIKSVCTLWSLGLTASRQACRDKAQPFGPRHVLQKGLFLHIVKSFRMHLDKLRLRFLRISSMYVYGEFTLEWRNVYVQEGSLWIKVFRRSQIQ